MKKENRNVYQMVTDRIIEQMEKGVIPWQRPWSGGIMGGAINYVTRRPYSLLNQMLLGRAGEWLTFNQVKDQGGSIKKGAKSEMVVFFTLVPYKDEDGKEDEDRFFPLLRYYRVFHINDTTGIESKIEQGEQEEEKLEPIDAAEKIITGYLQREPKLKFQNNLPSAQAYYSPLSDKVVVPMLSQYDEPAEYYSTTFHELVHSTMKADRCNRAESRQAIAAFGDEAYSREELVAEIGSAMLCDTAGIECEKAFKNSVAYIQGWLKKLKDDNHAIVWAASRAEKAAQYVNGEDGQDD